jgi:transglutaminase-like putative cysteine protease
MRFRCHGCRSVLECPDSSAGQRLACPRCGKTLQLPRPASAEPPPSPVVRKRPQPRERSAARWIVAGALTLGLVATVAAVAWSLYAPSAPRETHPEPGPVVSAPPAATSRPIFVATERPAPIATTRRPSDLPVTQPPPPSPNPPALAKHTPIEQIEKHSLDAPPEAERSLTELAKYLAEPYQADVDKVTAAYRWVTDRVAYDPEALFSGKRGDQSAEGALTSRKAICEGYSNLFTDLCGRMGVPVVRVRGRAKGVGENDKHTWNAVWCDGGWRLLDTTWGAGYLNDRQFKKDYCRQYLFAPPDLLIFTHLPEDPRWELLKTPVTAPEFTAAPRIPRGLFLLNPAAETLRAAMREKGFKEFPIAFSHPGQVTTVLKTAPLTRHLRAGDEYHFEFRCTEYEDLLILNEGAVKRFDRDGDVFRVTITPKAGMMQVAGRPPGDRRAHGIIQYVVE